jgi:small-conductance mechanosensitive channel
MKNIYASIEYIFLTSFPYMARLNNIFLTSFPYMARLNNIFLTSFPYMARLNTFELDDSEDFEMNAPEGDLDFDLEYERIKEESKAMLGSGDDSENSDGEGDSESEDKDFTSTVYRLKEKAEDNFNVRYGFLCLVTLVLFIAIFVFWNKEIETKEKDGDIKNLSLGIIFMVSFFSCIVFMFLSFILYNLSYIGLKKAGRMNFLFYYVNELSEHIALGLLCIGYISWFAYNNSNCCIQNNQGVELYIGDLLNITLICIFLFSGLKVWSKSISLNFNYSIFIERIKKCMIGEVLLSIFDIVRVENIVKDSDDDRFFHFFQSGSSARKNSINEYILKTFTRSEEEDPDMELSKRRILFKEFQKICKSRRFRKDRNISPEKYKLHCKKRACDMYLKVWSNHKIAYLEEINRYFRNEQISTNILKILGSSPKFRLDIKGIYKIIRRIDREKYLLFTNLNQINSALDRVCIFAKILILMLGGLMLYIKVSKELASTAGVISAIFGTQIISNSFSANAINSLIFLFIIHPYDIGDRIFVNIDNHFENLVVHELNVFSTVFYRWNGTCVYVPNSILSNKLITNVRRSGVVSDSHKIQINARTEQSKLLSLKSTLEAFLKKNSGDFTEYCMVNYEYIENSNKLHMKIYMQYKTNSQNYELYLKRKTLFLSYLNKCLQDYEIEYCLPPKRIVIRDEKREMRKGDIYLREDEKMRR